MSQSTMDSFVICTPCQIIPETSPKPKAKKPKTFEKSFASHQHVNFWHPTKNGKITPRDICKNTRSEFWWHCDTCSHDYRRSAFEMRTPCPYCTKTHIKLCGERSCTHCLSFSFASHPRANQWHPIKNVDENGDGLEPHQVHKGSEKKCWFKCHKCPHEFDATPKNITSSDSWCPYCCYPTLKLCDNDSCEYCHNKSLASIPRVVTCWHSTENGKLKPRDIKKGSNGEVWFKCSKCPHDFTLYPYQVSNGVWCPYCPRTRDLTEAQDDSPSKLCGERSCVYCLPFSFASHPRADQWHPTKNKGLEPHQVHRGSGKKCWFRCHKCPHDFQIKLCKVSSTGRWCSYCCGDNGGGTQKLCDDENCDYCFNNSLASSSFAMKLWFQEKNGNLNPRQIKKGTHDKCWWKCDVCFEPFFSTVGHVVSRGQSCPICKNKTEGAVYRALKECFGDIVKHLGQKKYKKNDPIWKHCPGYFDMVIEHPSGKTGFVEVDGRQHFEYVDFFRRTIEENQEIDLKKHMFALERGCYVIRIDQVWVADQIKRGITEWETLIIEAVSSQVCSFICDPQKNKYSNHKCYLFETTSNPYQLYSTSSP